jgi:hypothetical protein
MWAVFHEPTGPVADRQLLERATFFNSRKTALPAYTVSTVKYAVDLLWHLASGEAEAAHREEEAARAESKAAVHTGALSCVFVASIKPACTERGDS